jgi:prophage DNA circulation protein
MAEVLLKDSLMPASFRKIPFQVESTGFETGRRVQVHEYPQRDKPLAQDLGKATRGIEFDAFVVGPDYVEQADALIGALEEYGSGILVHPWFGSLTVNVKTCRVSFDRALGLAKFSLSFVEAGELEFPSSSESTAALSRQAAANLEAESVSWFSEAVSFANQVSDVADQALSLYGEVLSFIANPAFALANMLGFGNLLGNLSSLSALFGTPLELGWSFAGLLNLSEKAKDGTLTGGVSQSGAAASVSSGGAVSQPSTTGTSSVSPDVTLIPVVRGLTRMAVDPVLAAPVEPVYTTPTATRIHDNKTAILANARQLLLVQAVGLSSYLKCAIYDDTLAAKNELAAALDAEILQATDDAVYQALTACRAAMWKDLTERSRDSSRLVIITPDEVLPMLAIAYDYYENAGRDLEMDERNKIHNPNFVPVAALKVLSR